MNHFISQLKPSDLIIWRNNSTAEYLKKVLGYQVVTDENAFWQYDFSAIDRLVILKELDWRHREEPRYGGAVLQEWSLNYHFWQLPVSQCSIIKREYWQKIDGIELISETPDKKFKILHWEDINPKPIPGASTHWEWLKQIFLEINHSEQDTHESSIYALIGEFDYWVQVGEIEKAINIHSQALRGKLALLKVCLQKTKPMFKDKTLYRDIFEKDQCLIHLLDLLLGDAETLIHQQGTEQIHPWTTAIQENYLFRNTLLNQTILQNHSGG